MKRYILLIASVLFLWNFGFAQSPVIRPGTVSISVPKHLQINVIDPSLQFTYNEYNGWPPTNSLDWCSVEITSNLKWTLAITPLGGQTELINIKTSDRISAGLFEFRLEDVNGSITSGSDVFHKFYPVSAIPITGNKDVDFKIYWQPQPGFSGNLFAGDYKIGVSYVLSEQ